MHPQCIHLLFPLYCILPQYPDLLLRTVLPRTFTSVVRTHGYNLYDSSIRAGNGAFRVRLRPQREKVIAMVVKAPMEY